MVYEALLLQQFVKTGMFSRDCVFIIIQHGGCSMKTDVLSISGNSKMYQAGSQFSQSTNK